MNASAEQSRSVTLGQHVIVIARWILVAAALVLSLWLPESIDQLRLRIPVILLLAVGNFYLHAQLLRRKPVINTVAYAASAADFFVITLLIASEGGFKSGIFIFYFPALLGIALAFPTMLALTYLATVVAIYGGMAFGSAPAGSADVVIVRLLMLASIAVCGNLYWRIERDRRSAAVQPLRTPAQEAAEDLFFGQDVLIWARWFVIAAGTIVILSTAQTTGELSTRILLIVALMAINFFLHGRYLMERPANQAVLVAVSVIELAVFTAIVVAWNAQGALRSPLFVIYYPALLAFALVFPPRIALPYAALAIGGYTLACVLGGHSFLTGIDIKTLVVRVITLASVAGLGTYYWRIERDRRRSPAKVERWASSVASAS